LVRPIDVESLSERTKQVEKEYNIGDDPRRSTKIDHVLGLICSHGHYFDAEETVGNNGYHIAKIKLSVRVSLYKRKVLPFSNWMILCKGWIVLKTVIDICKLELSSWS
jgi:hypothetical protein